ncbi:GerMN domain-containing protein [Breznakiella homolactica]|uniref:GerMN domain-containing protein n=1 Tax=Breznakiella homolactica TaxID=2798577 RepID=A0A7T7XPN4_9SPIR|nr:GerMN domain-containing protein [Breznakiella homolactica]QQO10179.1 GerMN domain-containing protein [Breznakiella homolactica]
MATGKTTAKKKTSGSPQRGGSRKPAASGKKNLGCLFWIAFVIVVAGLFVVNWELIQKTVRDSHVFDRFSGEPAQTPPREEDIPELQPVPEPVRENPTAGNNPPETPAPGPAETNQPAQPSGTGGQPAVRPPEGTNPPAAGTNQPAQPSVKPQDPPAAPPAEQLRSRTMYFMRVDGDGTIVRTKSERKLPASDSPMVDTLQALLAGPSAEEQRRGLVSLIPQGTRILSATIRGSTAYISFSEEFQFNTFGAEGYTAQLRQIVWTVTEFPNINDVQILLEGRRLDYLGEGIWIGSPLSRDML